MYNASGNNGAFNYLNKFFQNSGLSNNFSNAYGCNIKSNAPARPASIDMSKVNTIINQVQNGQISIQDAIAQLNKNGIEVKTQAIGKSTLTNIIYTINKRTYTITVNSKIKANTNNKIGSTEFDKNPKVEAEAKAKTKESAMTKRTSNNEVVNKVNTPVIDNSAKINQVIDNVKNGKITVANAITQLKELGVEVSVVDNATKTTASNNTKTNSNTNKNEYKKLVCRYNNKTQIITTKEPVTQITLKPASDSHKPSGTDGIKYNAICNCTGAKDLVERNWGPQTFNFLSYAQKDYTGTPNGANKYPCFKDFSAMMPDLTSFWSEKIKSQITNQYGYSADQVTGYYFQASSSIAKDMSSSPELKDFVNKNRTKLENGYTATGEKDAMSFAFNKTTDLHYSFSGVNVIKSWTDDKGKLHLIVADTYDFNKSNMSGFNGLGVRAMMDNKLVPYYTMVEVVVD